MHDGGDPLTPPAVRLPCGSSTGKMAPEMVWVERDMKELCQNGVQDGEGLVVAQDGPLVEQHNPCHGSGSAVRLVQKVACAQVEGAVRSKALSGLTPAGRVAAQPMDGQQIRHLSFAQSRDQGACLRLLWNDHDYNRISWPSRTSEGSTSRPALPAGFRHWPDSRSKIQLWTRHSTRSPWSVPLQRLALEWGQRAL